METAKKGKPDMSTRVARFQALKPSLQAFVDTRLPEHRREIFNVIGRGVTEDASLQPAIAEAEGFNVTYIKAEPGKGAALHAHATVEVFIAMSGQWAVYYGDEGREEMALGPWDVVSVPAGVMRGFRNSGKQDAYLMAILGGTDAGHVTWSPDVLRKARGTGLDRDAKGNLVEDRY
ncbi:MAG: cupin domain-containing protein [Dehalococcoidia bacterium]|nr:cupin domain-containing protein [Dehalococcoidia bacterium]